MSYFNQRLKQLRSEKKISQQELSEKLGLNRATYARYETGDTEPDYKTLELLADFFDVQVDYLLGRTDKPIREIKKDNHQINVAYFGGAKEELTEEEAQRLKEELEMFRLLKEKKMREKKQ